LDNSAVRYRYASMWDKKECPSKKTDSMTKEEILTEDCRAILASALKCKETINKEGKVQKAFVCGYSKSYFRAGCVEYLEANRSSGLDAIAVVIQRIVRGMLGRMFVENLVGASARLEKEALLAKEKADNDAKEAREKATRDAQDKFESEKKEREEKFAAEQKKVDGELDSCKNELIELEKEKQAKLKEVAELKERLEVEVEDLKEQTSDDARKKLLEPKKIMAVQKKRLKEQTKMIDFLKKENKKIRKDHDKVETKYDQVVDNNEMLLKASDGAGDDFDKKEEAMSKVDKKNHNLSTTLDNAKKDNKTLKEQCMQKQDLYMSQAETRLEYQKAMARILTIIQDSSEEAQLIEDTVVLALEAESESKSIMAELEAETALM